MLAAFSFAFAITAPSFMLIALGAFLKRLKLIDSGFINTGSRVIFTIGLPALLFLGLYRLDLATTTAWRSIGGASVITLLITAVAWLYGSRLISHRAELGVFVQGSYRGNMAIIGLALCESAYGERGIAMAALPVGVLTALFNVIAVYLLSATHRASQASLIKVLASIAKNPLIIGITAGILVSLGEIQVPALLLDTGGYLAKMTIPLALICIGGSISPAVLRANARLALHASALRLLVAPALTVVGLWLIGIHGDMLAVMFLLSATPTAAASFVMVQAVNGNSALAASIIVWTTCACVLSLTVWLVILRSLQVI